MTDTNETGEKRLTLAPKTLSLKRPLEKDVARQLVHFKLILM